MEEYNSMVFILLDCPKLPLPGIAHDCHGLLCNGIVEGIASQLHAHDRWGCPELHMGSLLGFLLSIADW